MTATIPMTPPDNDIRELSKRIVNDHCDLDNEEWIDAVDAIHCLLSDFASRPSEGTSEDEELVQDWLEEDFRELYDIEWPSKTIAINKVLAAFDRLMSRPNAGIPEEWQPIETAPKDRPCILTNGVAVGEANYYATADGWWGDSHPTDFQDYKVYNPTHWMPLPQPPATTGESRDG